MSDVLSLIFIAFAVIGLSAGPAYGLGLWVQGLGVNDAPDGVRKTQAKPVSRLGGLAIILAAGLSYIPLAITQWSDLSGIDLPVALALGFTIIAFTVGLFDDLWTLDTKLKLMGLSAVCVSVTAFGLLPNAANLPFNLGAIFPLLIVGSALWLLVVTNAANFMDGSNGLAIGCLAIMLSGLLLIGWRDTFPASLLWVAPILGAIIGFLIHNLRGTLYAGDGGALGLGGLFAGLSLAADVDIWVPATLALPFLIDVLLTLIWRASRRRSWLEPHLDHAYQRLRMKGWSHLETAVLYWGLTSCCAGMAYIAALAGGAAPFIVFGTLTLSGIVLWTRHRRAISLAEHITEGAR